MPFLERLAVRPRKLWYLKMQYPEGCRPLILIVGPTAVGKSKIALNLAERLGGEIVSADSRLFYRGMDIGTAKPTFEEQKKVPHHLIDVTNPDEIWSLALFQEKAQQAISSIHSRHLLPFLVGGTGQFIRAVTEGWQPPIQPPDFKLRNALEKWAVEIGPIGLYQRMAMIDPKAAEKIDPNNLRRTIRALEVIFTTGEKFSAQRTRLASPVPPAPNWIIQTPILSCMPGLMSGLMKCWLAVF